MIPIRTTAALAIAAATMLGVNVLPAAAADHVSHDGVVSVVPATTTPDVNDGTVFAIAQTGSTTVIGGDFTSISPHGSSATTPVGGIAVFDATTGAIETGFTPAITGGTVNSIIPGSDPGTVYVGGVFTLNGKTSHLALLDVATGALVSGWAPSAINGAVNTLALSNGHLFVGGLFTSAGNASHVGLVVLQPDTGKVDTAYSVPAFTGHHNYGRLCDPTTGATCSSSVPGIRAMDVSPDGSRLVAIGNFTTVQDAGAPSSQPRDQLALLDLGTTAATVDPTWATDAYTASCTAKSFDSYVRGVQFSPDGSYFVVAATGGAGKTNIDGSTNTCDAAARFETATSSSDVLPTWVDYTGNDTFLSVAITGAVVYIGGHERWVNNSKGKDSAGEGAVPRPGITALDPLNGMPLSWNPGRNPRGGGAWSLLATSDGLYVGSDTNTIGTGKPGHGASYTRKRIAFFPLAGGTTLAADEVATLPGEVYLLGRGTDSAAADVIPWNGAPETNAKTQRTDVDWSSARGAFEIDNTVYYGSTDGTFSKRSFDGTTFGPAVAIDPYDDPIWDGVATGSDKENYDGSKSAFYAEIPSVTSMFYSAGRVYYTLAGNSHMFWRWFEPDSGVMGADEFTTTDTNDWSGIAGAFLSGSTLYFADASSGELEQVSFTAGEPTGSPSVADSSIDWASDGMFVLKASSETDLAVTPDTSAQQGEPVTLTATVERVSDPTTHPAGTVTFFDKASPVGSAPVNVTDGTASVTTNHLPPSGPNGAVLSASFQSTDSSVSGSVSPPLDYTINPVATTPTISGQVRVGATDRCVEPLFAHETAKYGWKVDGQLVTRATSFTIPAADLGKHLTCTATVSIGAGPKSGATSGATKVARGRALTVRARPKLAGPHRVGKKETVSLGKWSPAATSYGLQWYLGKKAIHGATSRSLRLKKSERGKRLSCRVTAHRAGYGSATTSSKHVKIAK